MPVPPASVVWTPYGRPALARLAEVVTTAKADDPLAPVTVLVSSNHVGVATRRALAARLGGIAAVTFLTPYRLAELLGSATMAAVGRRPLSTPVLAAAVRTVLLRHPGLFGDVATHAATELALVSAHRELRDLTDPQLDALASASPRSAEVVRVHRAVHGHLAGAWYDEQDLLQAATAAAPVRGGELGVVVVHLPQVLTPGAAALVEAVVSATAGVVLAGATGDAGADADVRASVRRLAGPDAPEPRSPGGSVPATVEASRTTVVTTSDADDEVRHAVRVVVDAATDGVPLHRMAILHASPEPYGRLLHEHLALAGVAANGSAVVPLAERVVARSLLHLLALPEGGFRREEVFAWLTAAPVLHDGRRTPTTAWERLSRDAGVVEGREQWDRRLATFAEDREAQAIGTESDPDAPAWLAQRHRDEARRAQQLRAFVCDLIDRLADAATGEREWGRHARWAEALLRDLLGADERREHDRWPAAELRAAEQVDRALARLRALDTVEGPVPLAVFTRTLVHELESDLGRVGRLGEGVLVGSVAMGTGLDLDLVVVVGLAEGSFPRPVRDDALLPDDARLACGGALALKRDRVEREHREFLAALAGAARQVLCVPRGDLRRSSVRVPSRWVLAVAGALAGRSLDGGDLASLDAPWIEAVPSFEAGLRSMPRAATATEHRMRSLLAGARVDDDALTAAEEALDERRSTRFTRFDGDLAGVHVPSPVSEPISATRLEAWASCPSAYLLGTVLGAKPVENPEEELELTALDRGNLVHHVLETFLGEVLLRPPGERPAPDEPWTAADHARIRALAEKEFAGVHARGRSGRPIFWKRDRRQLLAQFRRILDDDAAHRAATRTRPVAAEFEFGLGGAAPARLELADGRVLRLRGRADRIDVDADGMAHVIDYKTGGRDDELNGLKTDPVLAGTRLQLPIYALAARDHPAVADDAPIHSAYWFCSDKGTWRRDGYEVSDDVLARTREVLTRIVTGIESGLFPPHPSASTSNPFVSCRHCDPDGLGQGDLRRAWERKRDDPRLAAYADLVEPLDA